MFDELKKYKQTDHFLLEQEGSLKEVCNAPVDKSGVYIVYAIRNGQKELIYIGRSGKIGKNGSMFIRKAGLGGIKDRLVNGHQFGKIPRRVSWLKQMAIENIEALDVHWYATHNEYLMDCPKVLEYNLLEKFKETHNCLPKWNKI
jgi:hypothetical protein